MRLYFAHNVPNDKGEAGENAADTKVSSIATMRQANSQSHPLFQPTGHMATELSYDQAIAVHTTRTERPLIRTLEKNRDATRVEIFFSAL